MRGGVEAESVGSQEGQAAACVVAIVSPLPERHSEARLVAQCILLETGGLRKGALPNSVWCPRNSDPVIRTSITGTPYSIPAFGVAAEGQAEAVPGGVGEESVRSQEGKALTCVAAMICPLPERPFGGRSVAQCILLEVGGHRLIMAR